MSRLKLLLPCVLAAGCKFGDDRALGSSVDAAIDAVLPGAGHLLLTEVKSVNGAPAGAGTDEFLEIWNPTNREISLANYYLSDFVDYWKVPERTLPVVQADFVVRFPEDAVIASDQVITIATNDVVFSSEFGKSANYALNLGATAGATKAFRERKVVDTQLPGFTDTGEYIVLFYWDGVSDNVKDVDMVVSGATNTVTPANQLQSKMPVDGPDADTTATPYKAESGQLGLGMFTTLSSPGGADLSYKRRTLESGVESQLGTGNGISGDDETSEQLKSSWDGDSTKPYSAPTPGMVPAF
ncbi:MAG: lamin tail domain-containing protein [Myxococcales bacterium]|nr:lamin tail domain-containing protein [Myxococcales bacterium]